MAGHDHYNLMCQEAEKACMCDQLGFSRGMYMEVVLWLEEVATACMVQSLPFVALVVTCLWLKLVSPMIANLQVGSLGAATSQNSMTKPGVVFVIY